MMRAAPLELLDAVQLEAVQPAAVRLLTQRAAAAVELGHRLAADGTGLHVQRCALSLQAGGARSASGASDGATVD